MSNAPDQSCPTDPQRLVESIAEGACKSLFGAYGVELERVSSSTPPRDKIALGSVIGFTGPGIRGTCLLAATESPITESNPVAGGSLRDWIAELSNQLIGRVKNRLIAHGAEVYVTLPVVLRGEHLAPLPRHELLPLAFGSARGSVFVWFEVDSAPGFVLNPLPSSPEASIAEGAALLF